jgi:hypothetical protein
MVLRQLKNSLAIVKNTLYFLALISLTSSKERIRMNIRAHIGLIILTLGCAQEATAASFATSLRSLNKFEWSIVAAVSSLYGWYRSRKPKQTRCTLDDLLKGNFDHVFPDLIPGHPEVAGKVTIKNVEGEGVEFIYKEKIEGAGPFNWIESNIKDIAKISSVAVITYCLLKAHKSESGILGTVQDWILWIIEHTTKVKP